MKTLIVHTSKEQVLALASVFVDRRGRLPPWWWELFAASPETEEVDEVRDLVARLRADGLL
jgi:hypothetical protein